MGVGCCDLNMATEVIFRGEDLTNGKLAQEPKKQGKLEGEGVGVPLHGLILVQYYTVKIVVYKSLPSLNLV